MRRLLLILVLALASIAAGAQTLVNGSWAVPIANEGVTGTTTNKLVKLTGAPSTAIITAITDTAGAVGICAAGCTTTGNATVVQWGLASCVFDGATTAGNYVAISSSTAGDCHDAGSSRPGSGQIIGRVLSTNASGGTYLVSLAGLDDQGATAGSGTVNSGTAGQLSYYATSTNAVSGNANANISGGTLTLGVSGSQAGGVTLVNATSGSIALAPPTGALGTTTITVPAGSGTVATSATSPITESAAGVVACATCTTNASALTANLPVVGGGSQAAATLAIAPSTLTDGATITWAIASAYTANATVTLGGNRTLNITNPQSGGTYILRILQDATGTRTLTLGTGCTWKVSGGGAGAITLSTAANAIDVLAFYYDGTNCYANLNKNFS